MRLIDGRTTEIEVGRDPERSSVELTIATAGEDSRTVHLSRDEARRLAAHILFQAERLDKPEKVWRLPHPGLERRSA